MNIILTRRISQIFFFLLFFWFCLVSTLGERLWQLRGWPVNWFLQLDPLVGIGTLLTTRTLYSGLAWCLTTIVLTLLLGRFFCGWVCPFGALHQFFGYLGKCRQSLAEKRKKNQYRNLQYLKYWLLIFLLTAAVSDSIAVLTASGSGSPGFWAALLVLGVSLFLIYAAGQQFFFSPKSRLSASGLVIGLVVLAASFEQKGLFIGSLQTGLLDPIPLVHRSVNLVLLPILDRTALITAAVPRFYEQAWLIGLVFFSFLFLNLRIPRFYCRFVCPLGALFGILSRFYLGRIGQTSEGCTNCKRCEADCEGACSPSENLQLPECVLCMNCRHTCPEDLIRYSIQPSIVGETTRPNLERRNLIVAAVSGVAAVPLLRLGGSPGPNWHPDLIRPPGALAETAFLNRCLKCGQCMRVCPTNIIQPAGLLDGMEAWWTPRLNFRIGTSGCQLNCIACGNICPTAAIRPLSLAEKHGKGDFSKKGPIRMGTAFMDRTRCLPWAMNKPCIVCQENCPVSPKAIFTQTVYQPVHFPEPLQVQSGFADRLILKGKKLPPGKYATGDYEIQVQAADYKKPVPIIQNTEDTLQVGTGQSLEPPPPPGSTIAILVRLQRPLVNPEACIGCGTCEHECPVSGKRAIRVTAENESRERKHKLLL